MNSNNEKISHPITTSEAFHLLNPLRSRYKNARSDSYKIFKETLDYTEVFCRIKDKCTTDDLRSALASLGFTEDEIALLGTLLPQTADEARILAPSIIRLESSIINIAIEKIQHSI